MQPNLSTTANSGIPVGIRRKAVDDAALKDAKGHAAGVLFVAPDGDVLMLRRSSTEPNYGGHWSLPGGKVEEGETPDQGAKREAEEEMGGSMNGRSLKLIDQRMTPTGMAFHTFAHPVEKKFQPKLNSEHSGFTWSPLNQLPQPMHPGVKATLSDRIGSADDMSPEDWNGFRDGFLKFIAEEEDEPEHANDLAIDLAGVDAEFNESDHPREQDGKFGSGGGSSGSGNEQKSRIMSGLKRIQEEHNALKGKLESKKISSEELDRLESLNKFVLKHKDTIGSLRAAHDAASGKLNEKERAEADRGEKDRAEMPESAFLEPATRKYPVKAKVDGEWKYTSNLLLAAARRARMEKDESLAKRADEIRAKEFGGGEDEITATDSALMLALDRDPSVRRIDEDGHLHVAQSVISKAVVSPYRGSEIPGWRELGLQENEIYNLLRGPDELAKAAPTFNGKPLLLRHRATDSKDHQHDLVIGSVSNPVFEDPDLKAELVIWPQDAIDAIKDGSKKEISCGYRYVPVMESGTWNGQPYAGRMTQMCGNHVAIIPDGRVPGAIIGDSAEELQWAIVESALSEFMLNA